MEEDIGEVASLGLDEEEGQADPRTRRLRALLHTQPVHALELNKASRGKEKYAPYDLIVLQLEAIDFITDNMDAQRGVLEEEVQQHLARLAAVMAPKRSRGEHLEVATVVLSGLENEGGGRFLIPYNDPANPTSRVRADVELVRPVQGEDGSVELRVTPQAINLLLDALDTDIESAENAMAFMFQFQFERGRLSKAAAHAQNMRRLSISYREHVQGFLTDAARDISRVDWAGEVMDEIDRAYRHLETRLRDDANTLSRVAEQHDATPELDHRAKLAEIRDLLEDCGHRHRELHTELMSARAGLRQHHAQQRLAPPPSVARVDLHADILQATLGLRPVAAASVLEAFAAGLIPPVPPPLLQLRRVVDHQWRPQLERGVDLRPIEEIDFDEDDVVTPVFSSEAIATAVGLLSGRHERTRLSQLLTKAFAERTPPGADHLLALGALEAFMEVDSADTGDDEEQGRSWRLVPRGLSAEPSGERLDGLRFGGDDLELTSRMEPE